MSDFSLSILKILVSKRILDYNLSHFSSQVCSHIFVISSLPACGRSSLFLHYIIYSMMFFSALNISARKNCLKVELILSSIKFPKNRYLLNLEMDITTKQEIILFRLMLCVIVLLFGATYVIELFIDFFWCVKHM